MNEKLTEFYFAALAIVKKGFTIETGFYILKKFLSISVSMLITKDASVAARSRSSLWLEIMMIV